MRLFMCLSLFLVLSLASSQESQIRVRILPPYDAAALRGISPNTSDYLANALAPQSGLEIVPLTAKQYRGPIHNTFNKKFIVESEVDVGMDVIVMSKLELIEQKEHMEDITWTLSLRLYHVHKDVQEDFAFKYRVKTSAQLKKEILVDGPLIAKEISKFYSEQLTGKGYDQLADEQRRRRYTQSDYNTDLKSVPNINRPEKSVVTDPSFDTALLWQIWSLDNEGPHADFWWKEAYFRIVDYDGNGSMPYLLKQDSLTVYYNDFIKKGIVKKVSQDSLQIQWHGQERPTNYVKWTK